MKATKPSMTAQHIALARAHLTWRGILNDPFAEAMLQPRWAWVDRTLRHRPLTRLGLNRVCSQVGARTRFFDDAVIAALDTGVHQVVVLGAGYDTRAWRLARDDVRFFEVDHPATQEDKRSRAPVGGPAYIAAVLPTDRLADLLTAAGFVVDEPAVFIAEGLTQYLPESAVSSLMETLAALARPGSHLVANFGLSFAATISKRRPAAAWMLQRSLAAAGEPARFLPPPDEVTALLAETGWIVARQVTSPEAARDYLAGTGLPVATLNPQASMVSAVRS